MNTRENKEPIYQDHFEDTEFVTVESKDLAKTVKVYECKVKEILNFANSLSSNIKDIVISFNQTSLMIKEIDAKLDLFLAQVDADVQKFTVSLPVIERQLNRISSIIDKFADEIISRNRGNLTREELEQQSILLQTLQTQSESFNNLIIKLLR